MKRLLSLASVLIGVIALPIGASAHSLGPQYTLPLPASFYISGGVIALLVSCAILFLRSSPYGQEVGSRVILFSTGTFVRRIGKGLGLFFFALIVVTGALGSRLFYENPAPLLFWSFLLLWFAYGNALVGGLWERINPFKTIAAWALQDTAPLFRYPEKWGYLPALFVYFALIWVELFASPLAGSGFFISVAFQAYLLAAILGSFLFGIDAWFSRADFFSVFFGLIGKIAPLSFTEDKLEFESPIKKLSRQKWSEPTLLVFVFFLLSSTLFDGLRETSLWVDLILALPAGFGTYFYPLSQIALFLSPLLFAGIYFLTASLMRKIGGSKEKALDLAMRFLPSLVPIGIAYSIAHYAGYLFVDIQYLIPLVSDPLGLGWNLFGTDGYGVNANLVGPQAIWYIQLFAVIGGHIFSALVAHRIARSFFATKWAVMGGQLPLIILMVFYTAAGLWILSEPYALPL
jgi:hypothetical protein